MVHWLGNGTDKAIQGFEYSTAAIHHAVRDTALPSVAIQHLR